LLRILIGEDDRYQNKPLYEQIVLRARELKLAGATVFKGIMGFGAYSLLIRSSRILQLSEDMPIVIEIIDTEENIKEILSNVVDERFYISSGKPLCSHLLNQFSINKLPVFK